MTPLAKSFSSITDSNDDIEQEETELVSNTLYRKVASLKKVYNRLVYGPPQDGDTPSNINYQLKKVKQELEKAEQDLKNYFFKG